jgi:hypothetical protein
VLQYIRQVEHGAGVVVVVDVAVVVVLVHDAEQGIGAAVVVVGGSIC